MRLKWMLCGIACLAACAGERACDGPGGSCAGDRLPSAKLAEQDAQTHGAPERAQDAAAKGAEAAIATAHETEAGALDAGALDAGTFDAGRFEAGAFDATGPRDVENDTSPARPCSADSVANANGVRIHVEGDRCNFAYGQGGTFRYRVTLDRPLPYRVAGGGSCGFCSQLGADVKPLTRALVVAFADGGLVSYCADCDVGCCGPNREASHQLTAQSHEAVLDWPARSFNGPSDTGAKPGAFFPVGQAQVMISVELPGQSEFAALAKLPITIE